MRGRDSARIRSRLAVLLGLRVGIARRAVDMRILQFGDVVRVDGYAVGAWALHLQCAWRVTDRSGVVTGRDDGFAVQDRRLARWLRGAGASHRPRVRGLTVGEGGSFSLDLGARGRLDVLPCGSGDVEDWRFFDPGDPGPHLVVRGGAIERGTEPR